MDRAVELKSLITEARQVYEAAGLDCGDGLLPPATEADIDSITAALSQPVPGTLRHPWRPGVHPPGVTGLFGQHRLLSPAEAIEAHTISVENHLEGLGRRRLFRPSADDEHPAEWAPVLIPFASWDA